MLTIQQINELLDIFDKKNLVFIAKHLGPEYLTPQEIENLMSVGINPYNFYNAGYDVVRTSFYFGLISDIISKKEAKALTFKELSEDILYDNYIPLTKVQRNTIDSVKKQFLGDIRSSKGKIFQDINNIIGEKEKNNRAAYEAVIRNEIESGIVKKKTNDEIARDLGRKTGDWSRNFNRIVEYVSHQAFDEGRASLYEEQNGPDVLVYKDVFIGACKHCVKAYLTNGIGSEPIIFKLSKLKANGTNIGRKTADYLATLGNLHPHCRCTICRYNPMYSWNKQTGSFDIPNLKYKPQRVIERKKVRMTFNNKEYLV